MAAVQRSTFGCRSCQVWNYWTSVFSIIKNEYYFEPVLWTNQFKVSINFFSTMTYSIYYFQRFSLGGKLLFFLWVQEKNVNLKYNPALNQLIPRPLLSPPTSSVITTDSQTATISCSFCVVIPSSPAPYACSRALLSLLLPTSRLL